MSNFPVLGPMHMIILRAVASGDGSNAHLNRVMKAHTSPDVLARMLQRLHADMGLLRRKRGGAWALTERGAALLPSPGGLPPMAQYRPPVAPPRRPGAEAHRNVASLLGSQRRDWRHPC